MSNEFPTPTPNLAPAADGDETIEARLLIVDLYALRPALYWSELFLLAIAGWGGVALAAKWGFAAWQTYPAMLVSTLALYRVGVFSHEISHMNATALPGFRNVWDALVGIPLMIPSFIYVGMHRDHHKISTYGTPDDPEYLPMAGHKGQIVRFAAGSFLLPVLCALRFVILSPIGFFSRRFHDSLERHASSLTINHEYQRYMSDAERSRMYVIEALTLAFGWLVIALAVGHVIPGRAFAMWYVVLAISGLVNTIRTLGAHRYESDGRPMTRLQQLHDSIDTPGGFWTELWAPVGLRYHALHHYFPGVPYHNLGKAYRRLIEALGKDATFRFSTSPSLADSLGILWNHPPVTPHESVKGTMSLEQPPAAPEERAA